MVSPPVVAGGGPELHMHGGGKRLGAVKDSGIQFLLLKSTLDREDRYGNCKPIMDRVHVCVISSLSIVGVIYYYEPSAAHVCTCIIITNIFLIFRLAKSFTIERENN